MLGLGDFSVFAAYALCIVSAALCVIYGIRNWNRGGEVSAEVAREEMRWDTEERKIDSELSGTPFIE